MQSFGKRQKELARLEHRKEKEAKRAERKRLKAERPAWKRGDPDPSIEFPADYQGPGAPPAPAPAALDDAAPKPAGGGEPAPASSSGPPTVPGAKREVAKAR